jgi:hypothetical protein
MVALRRWDRKQSPAIETLKFAVPILPVQTNATFCVIPLATSFTGKVRVARKTQPGLRQWSFVNVVDTVLTSLTVGRCGL